MKDVLLLFKLGNNILSSNTSGRGLEAHTAILYALVSKGEEVVIPWADHLRYDLAFVRYEVGVLGTNEPRLVYSVKRHV